MKRILMLLLIAASTSLRAQEWTPHYYLPVEQMPDATRFLPDYPRPGNPLFTSDSLTYQQAKQLRNTPRGKQAVADTSLFVRHFMQRFGEAAGISLTPEQYPILAQFLDNSYTTIRLSVKKAKTAYSRHRPYQHFGEPTPVPTQEEPDDYTSYPSGHAIRVWGAALVMVAVDPEHQDAYLQAGYELGQSRVIVGYHYQSDVDAARLAAGAGFARLVADKKWQRDLRRAQREFRKKNRQ